MSLLRPGGAVLALTLLAGCVSDPGYAPMDPAANRYFGYSDTPNGAGGHTIRVVLPEGVENPKSAFAHWERRAGELCGPAGYRKQLHTARRNMMMMPGYTPTGYSYEVMGDVWCNDPAMAPADPVAAPTVPAA
ncbi:hypothetical protein [Brevundimonas sp.]|uniref:hypothetical protein n=1 Tax=Brevundimonas sp. TaxID=1871086 RepID=UPI002ED893F1